MNIARTALVLGAVLLLAAGFRPAQSQQPEDAAKITDMEVNLMRKDLRDKKKQLIAANLPLTGDEAARFWPVYDAYTKETIKLNDGRYGLVKEYAANYTTMTDAQASSLMRRWITADETATKLRLAWVPKFEAVLGPKKTAIFFQIDRRIGLMQEIQLASQLPLVQP